MLLQPKCLDKASFLEALSIKQQLVLGTAAQSPTTKTAEWSQAVCDLELFTAQVLLAWPSGTWEQGYNKVTSALNYD